MIDIDANNIGPVATMEDLTKIIPFNLPEMYHGNCTIDDWTNQW